MMDLSKRLFPAGVIDKNGIMYYVTHFEHIIKKLNVITGEIEFVDNPEGYNLLEWCAIDKLLWHKDKLYLFEENGKRVLEYSLLENHSKCINLNCGVHLWDNWVELTIFNEQIFAFHCYANQLVKIDFQVGTVVKQEIYSGIKYIFEQEKKCYTINDEIMNLPSKLFSCSCHVGTDIWLFTERMQIVIKYDLNKEKGIKYLLPEAIKGCIYAKCVGNIFYILSSDGNIYCWNYLNNHVRNLFDSIGEFRYPYYYKFVMTNKNIWVIPSLGKDIFIIDLKSLKKRKYCSYPKDFSYIGGSEKSKYYGYMENEINYYFAMHSANYMLIINKESGNEKWIRPIEPGIKEQISYYQKRDKIQLEKVELGLNEFIFFAAAEEEDKTKKNLYIAGKTIFNNI